MNNKDWFDRCVENLFALATGMILVLYICSSIITLPEVDKLTEEISEENSTETVEYNLSLKEIKNNKEIWKTYTVNVIDTKENLGIYWLDNSKTEGYKIKVKFNEDGTVDISEHTEDNVQVRSLAKLDGGSISIKHYDKIETQEEETDKTLESEE